MLNISTKIYKIVGTIFFIVACGFSGFSFYTTHHNEIKTTHVGAKMENNDESLVFKNASYYKNSSLLEVEMFYQGSLGNGLQELKTKIYNAQTGEEIQGKLEQINLNYYVVFIPKVENIKQILVQMLTSDPKNSQTKELGTISITQKNIQEKGTFEKKTTEYYEQRYVSDLTSDAKQSIKNYDEKIKNLTKDIEKFEEANNRLRTKLDFETAEEQKQTNSEIDSNLSQIDSVRGQIQEAKKAQKSLKDKISLLENK